MSELRVGPFVSGKELVDGGGDLFDVMDPATGQRVAVETCCDAAQVGQVVESSAAAFHSAEWQSATPSVRGQMLLKLADLVEERAEELIDLELRDVGKPISQLRGGGNSAHGIHPAILCRRRRQD